MKKTVKIPVILLIVFALALTSCNVQNVTKDNSELGNTGENSSSSGDNNSNTEGGNNDNTGGGTTGGNGVQNDKPTTHTHDFVTEGVAPTEKYIGYSYKYCKACGFEETKYLEPTAPSVEQPIESLTEYSLKSAQKAVKDAEKIFERVIEVGSAQIFSMPMMDASEYVVVREFTLELIKDCTTETEKARVIYDWIVENIVYDYEYVTAPVYKTFTDKKAVCFGFTALMHDMLTAADILSIYTSGITNSLSVENLEYSYIFEPITAPTAISHAWVMFYADGEVICCDPTWSSFYSDYDNGFDLSAEVISKTHIATNLNALTVIPEDIDARLYLDAYCLVGDRIFFVSNGKLGNLAPAYVIQNSIEYNMIPYNEDRVCENDIPNSVTSNGFFRFWKQNDVDDETYWYYALPDGRSYLYSQVLEFVMSMKQMLNIDISIEKMDKFVLQDGLIYRDKGNYLILIASVGTEKNITIPATVNGKAVKVVGPGAFKDNGLIEEVVISYGVEEIMNDAFNGAIALKKIEMPTSLKKIGQMAFCDNVLTEIVIPEGVTELNGCPIAYQIYLTSISLPASYTPEQYYRIYLQCPALDQINVANGSVFSSVEGVLFADNGKILVAYPTGRTDKTYVIPEGVTDIAIRAFQNSLVENIVFPSTLLRIGESAFFGCKNLTSLNLPEGLISVEAYAFGGCDSLVSVRIPDSMTSIESLFQQCSSLREVYIGKNVKNMNNAFLSSGSIEQVIISSENKYFKIVDGAVLSYDGKTLVYYPSGRDADVFVVPAGVINIKSYVFDDTKLSTIVLPEGLVELSSTVFMFNDNLTALVLPSTLKTMPALPILAPNGAVYCSFARNSVPSGVKISNYVTAYYLDEWVFVDGIPTPVI